MLHIGLCLKLLQTSVTNFANSSKDKHNPEELVFIGPRVLASKEIQELSNSVEMMSNHMKDYVIDILEKEQEVHHGVATRLLREKKKPKKQYKSGMPCTGRQVCTGQRQCGYIRTETQYKTHTHSS